MGQLRALIQSQVSLVAGEVFSPSTIPPYHAGPLWVVFPMDALDVLLTSLLHVLENVLAGGKRDSLHFSLHQQRKMRRHSPAGLPDPLPEDSPDRTHGLLLSWALAPTSPHGLHLLYLKFMAFLLEVVKIPVIQTSTDYQAISFFLLVEISHLRSIPVITVSSLIFTISID